MTVNRVILLGNVGKEPELSYMPDNSLIVKFSLATSETYKDKEGNKKTNTEWHNIVVFGKLAEVMSKWLTKGQSVYVEGKLKTNKYQDKETGKDKYSTSIVAENIRMLGGKSDNQDKKEDKTLSVDEKDIPDDAFSDSMIPF